MSDIYGNNPSTGGFQNPAIENLDMSTNYKIINLKDGVNPKDAVNVSQLTSSNPFNQSLNTYNDVQFQNVNMNGNWNIPNNQPASINDPNLYIISAQGGLVTIPAGPSFTIKAQMIASPQVDVVIPIPHMAYSYLDLCQLIQNSYNTNAIDVIYRGTMTICQYGLGGYLIIEITRELIHLSGTFIIVYDGPNTPSAALGYTATFTTPCNSIAVAQSPLVFSTFVGWKALGSSTTPITNGSPYTYSSSQDKWYTNELLYSDNFLNYFSQNNTEFTINQNGFTKFIMNEDPNIGTSLWGPSGSGRIELINSRINLRQNSINRIVINNAETYSFSPSLLNYSYKSNTEVATFFNSVNRFSIDLTNSLLCSPNSSNNINVMDSAISLSNTSSLNKLSLSNLGLVYAFNNVAKMIMNANNFVIANGTTNRLDINGTDSKVISASGNNSLYIGDTAMTLTYNAVDRLVVDSTKTRTLSPDNNNYLDINNNGLTYTDASINRLSISDTTTYIAAPSASSYCSVSNTGCAFTVDALNRFTASSGGNTTIKSFDNTTTLILAGDSCTMTTTTNSLLLNADFTYNKGVQNRIHADNSHTQLVSPNGTQAIEANNTGVQINLGTDNYKLPTTRGTVGQVLTYSGISTTWANPSPSYNAGFSLFSPLESTGTIGSGNKPYWYIVMVPCNTVLTGFKTLLATGSDPFHVAIYRGRVGGSSATILDLLAPIVTVAGNGYYSAAFVVQAGRSNVYTAGEYITVMYHSQGSTNSFYNFIAISDTNIAYTTSANYGNATPPANLGSTPILGTIANRLAIEFY